MALRRRDLELRLGAGAVRRDAGRAVEQQHAERESGLRVAEPAGEAIPARRLRLVCAGARPSR